MTTEGPTNTPSQTVLDPSAVASGVGGAPSTPNPTAGATPTDAAATEQRIAGLMSLYNKEQNERQKAEAEVTRLQGLLATAVASEHATKQALADAGANQTQVVQSVEARATAAESNVAELQREVARLTADGNRLAFLVKNPDIAGYADILPASTDTASLERAAATIRAAHETEIGRMRDHLTGGKASSGRQTPRVGNSAMSAAQIDTYLREAPHGEFERRLAEVTGRA